MEFTIEETGLGALEARLAHAIEEIDDLTEPLLRGAYFTQEMTLHNFASEGGLTEDGQWEPLTEYYAAWKAARAGGMPILQLRQDLIEDAANPSAVTAIGHDEAYYTIADRKAAWHHYGAERSRGGVLPARPIIPDEFFLLEPIEDIVSDWVEDVLEGRE